VSAVTVALQLDGGDEPTIRITDNPTADGSMVVLTFGQTVVTFHSDYSPVGAADELGDWLRALADQIDGTGATP
jgi:hypothetical protein